MRASSVLILKDKAHTTSHGRQRLFIALFLR